MTKQFVDNNLNLQEVINTDLAHTMSRGENARYSYNYGLFANAYIMEYARREYTTDISADLRDLPAHFTTAQTAIKRWHEHAVKQYANLDNVQIALSDVYMGWGKYQRIMIGFGIKSTRYHPPVKYVVSLKRVFQGWQVTITRNTHVVYFDEMPELPRDITRLIETLHIKEVK